MKTVCIPVTIFLTFFVIQKTSAQQNVGIGTNVPNASSLLDISSTSKGMLIPRMNNAQLTAVTNPATGLFIYQTDIDSGFY